MAQLPKGKQTQTTYRNPVIYADYSDPDVLRVDDTYYLTASSFNYIPGLPILTSKDLVNWKLEAYALDCIDYPDYEIPQHSRGVWAPSIRYHDGMFYIFYGMPDEGIFMVRTRNPIGEWEKPVCVYEGKGLIDPCPFWDEDGTAVVVHAYANSRIGFKSRLGMFEISPDASRATGPDHFIYDGNATQLTIEGPKVYRKDGYYYIFAPAGGVKQGWQTVLRSRTLFTNEWEERIVMRQGESPVNGPHQGGWVTAPDGSDWFLHFQDRGLYGRITHLQPVFWKEGWPVIGTPMRDNPTCGEPVSEYTMPVAASEPEENGAIAVDNLNDDFRSGALSLQWQWMGNLRSDFYELLPGEGILRLNSTSSGDGANPTLWRSSNVLTSKIVMPSFAASVSLDANRLEDNERAGLTLMGGEYAYVAVRRTGDILRLVYGVSETIPVDERIGKLPMWVVPDRIEHEREIAVLPQGAIVKLCCSLKAVGEFLFVCSVDGREIPIEDQTFFPSDHTWVGAKTGLFAIGERDKASRGFADFRGFEVVAI